MTRYLAFDLETTGTNPDTDRIVEFCFIEMDDALQEQARWCELVHPAGPIPPAVTRVHGITDAMVADARPFSAHAPRIQRLIGVQEPAVLIGHNVRFDVQFLHNELQRAGSPGLRVDHPTIDTSYLESVIHPKNLAALHERYTGTPLDGAHRSEADTAATVAVLRGQLRDHGGGALPEALTDLETQALKRARDPERARTWLDHGRRFYEDHEGAVCFGFGKYRDRRAADHPDYLQWMLRQDFPPEVTTVIHEILREADAGAASSSPPALPTTGPRSTTSSRLPGL